MIPNAITSLRAFKVTVLRVRDLSELLSPAGHQLDKQPRPEQSRTTGRRVRPGAR